MNQAIATMLKKYPLKALRDYENALKEIIQEIALLGLWRSKFFEHAAFYGGTALRILYGLDRFSEDIDFSLLKPNPKFDISKYHQAIKTELESFDLKISINKKDKTSTTNIDSTFIKAGTLHHFIKINTPKSLLKKMHAHQMIKIKIEVDKNPPPEFKTEAKYLLQPIPFSVNTFQLPDLFAGKMHALLCRKWKSRVKGRDWYDFVWYVGNKTPVRIKHLEKRMQQTGHFNKQKDLTQKILNELLKKRIENIDFENAKKDVLPFLKDPESTTVWSKKFFMEILSKLKVV